MKLEKYFEIRKMDITENPKSKEKGCVSFYAEKEWFELKIRKELQSDHPVKGLDVELLTNLVFNPIFGKILIKS